MHRRQNLSKKSFERTLVRTSIHCGSEYPHCQWQADLYQRGSLYTLGRDDDVGNESSPMIPLVLAAMLLNMIS